MYTYAPYVLATFQVLAAGTLVTLLGVSILRHAAGAPPAPRWPELEMWPELNMWSERRERRCVSALITLSGGSNCVSHIFPYIKSKVEGTQYAIKYFTFCLT